jgi:antirestriction protein ArdC
MRKNYTPNPDGLSAEDRALNVFADIMIDKIKNLQQDWKQPWISPGAAQLPRNLNGRNYNGMNSIILMFMQEKNNWQTSRYATFDRITDMNYAKDKDGKRQHMLTDKDGNKLPFVRINKGEKSTPVMITTFTCVHKQTNERIKYDDYKQLDAKERNEFSVFPKQHVYNVFNVDQTNLKEARPELYETYRKEAQGTLELSDKGMASLPEIDAMIAKDLYVCPIKPTAGNDAYYSVARDEIIIPEKAQFIDGESFYSNLLHEMSHASGSPDRLNRIKPTQDRASYSREELVAELTAALVSSRYGMAKHVKSDSAAYLKSWLGSLNENPEFIKTTLNDVKRSASFITQRMEAVGERLRRDGWDADFTDIRQQNKTFTPLFRSDVKSAAVTTEATVKAQEQPIKEENQVLEAVSAKSAEQPRFHR